MEPPPNFLLALPTELSLDIVKRAAAASANPLATLAAIRSTSRAGANLATDLLVSESVKRFCAQLDRLQEQVNAKWSDNPSEQEGKRLTNIFNAISRISEQIAVLRKKVEEKQASRALIVKDAAKLPPATVDAVLATMGFGSELLLLQELRKSLKKEEEGVQHFRQPNYAYRDPRDFRDDPLRDDRFRNPGFYPRPPPPGFFPSGPDYDHLPPPDWERDRQPLPGMPWDPNPYGGPFGPGPQGAPNPFNPHGGGQFGGRGPRGPRYL